MERRLLQGLGHWPGHYVFLRLTVECRHMGSDRLPSRRQPRSAIGVATAVQPGPSGNDMNGSADDLAA
jgi:hypothetical protein